MNALSYIGGGGTCGGDVTYDSRSLIVNGHRKILFSGSIHYPRSTPEMWPSLISQAKQGGLDCIQTYVFWNLHEPKPGEYDFSGRKDLVSFIKEIQAQGLYASLRIGPFIESEWNYGGLPVWLRNVPNIEFRTNNEPFKFYMRNFTTKIVNLMKSEGLYASQGGPIILSQIENEYHNVEKGYGADGPAYVSWAANMAVGLQTGVPWMMCKQDDAPDPVINACNGMMCGETDFKPNSPNKPALWAENWTARYQLYGNITRARSPENIAYQVALFIAKKKGSFINYYMYHGGTNFGRTTSSYVPTSYYDQAPLDEYGLINQPKWGHLKELHAAVQQSSKPLLFGSPTTSSLGEQQEAYVFQEQSGQCAAFLVNSDPIKDSVITFQNTSYGLPHESISILPDCKTVAFNTAKISTQSNTRSAIPVIKFDSAEIWTQSIEPVPKFDKTSLRSNSLLEQLNTTQDTSDYLWYTFRFQPSSSSNQHVLQVNSTAHVVRAFINGELSGSAHGSHYSSTSLQTTISLTSGTNYISLLSALVGLRDSGAHLERWTAGVVNVMILSNEGVQEFNDYPMGYQIGLLGEKMQIYTEDQSSDVNWTPFSSSVKRPTWYKSTFDAPTSADPVALNLGSMGKGEAWINGQSIGRYWVSFLNPAGTPTQKRFHVPRSFLKPRGNLLVLFEEEYGNPLKISIGTVFRGKPTERKMLNHSSNVQNVWQ